MKLSTQTPKNLETRFHPPIGWTWDSITSNDYTLRYGYTSELTGKEKATLVILPGLSEYCEKYFETINELQKNNIASLCIDWRGQGLSCRYLENPHKRHTQGLKLDAHDLQNLLDHTPITKNTQSPLIMLAHSMGGNIGLHTLKQNPNKFSAAAFIAPLCGLHTFQNIPDSIATATTTALKALSPSSYAPLGGDWNRDIRDHGSYISFSSDTIRAKVHNEWMLENPELQIGHITHEWLHDAHQACLEVQKKDFLKEVNIPYLVALAGHEYFVDNKKARQVFRNIDNAMILEFPEARHEILMEKEQIRSRFMTNLYSLIDQIILK